MGSQILNRLVSQLMAKGMSQSKAIGIATHKLQQSGNLDNYGNDTMQGAIRGSMTPENRAKDREVKYRGGMTDDYDYNEKTNRVTKRR